MRRQLSPKPNERKIFVRVHVPANINHRIPDVVRYKKPDSVIQSDRKRKLALGAVSIQSRNRQQAVIPDRKTIERRIGVIIPRKLPRVPPHYVDLRRNILTVHSQQAHARVLAREPNRRRYEEKKSQRVHARDGQLGSMRHDRYGILAAAVSRGMDVQSLSEAAMVVRGL